MAVDVDVTIDGFNKYIAGLNEAEVPSYFKLIMFNSHEGIRSMTRFLEVSAVPGLSRISYRPSGGTPLLDAVGEAIALTEKAVIDSGADPGVVVAILTDGLENSSLEYSSEAIKSLITEKQRIGWKFVFLAADQDAVGTGRGMGISPEYTSSFNSSEKSQAFETTLLSTLSAKGRAANSRRRRRTR